MGAWGKSRLGPDQGLPVALFWTVNVKNKEGVFKTTYNVQMSFSVITVGTFSRCLENCVSIDPLGKLNKALHARREIQCRDCFQKI